MQKKRKSNTLLLGLAAMIAVMFLWIGCGGDSGGETNPIDPNNPNNPPVGNPTTAPEKPRIVGSQTGFELINVDLKTVTEAQANDEANQSAVVSLKFEGDGAASYNLYWAEDSGRPAAAQLTGARGPVAFARNLKPETDYYFWVEAVNPKGTAVSEFITKTTGKKGPQAGGGMERGHYPEDFQVVPGNGYLTVSWKLSDRVGWYEVYYAKKGDIKHLDAYTPIQFRFDSSKELLPGAIDVSGGGNVSDSIAYKGNNNTTGHTRALYPYLSPLAPNSGYEGYYVRDGATRVDGDTRPVIGTESDQLKDGVFYKIFEAYDKGIQDPYKPLDAAFAKAIPWDGTKAGTPGTPIKFFNTSVNITGLENGTEYEVWIRCPNANGERAYSYVVGTPGTSNAIAAPSNVTVTTPEDSAYSLDVTWNAVSAAESYRIYTSKFDYTPNASASYGIVEAGTTSYTVKNLDSDTDYYVWVVAQRSGVPSTFGTPVTGKTGKAAAPTVGHSGNKYIAGTDKIVKTAVYIEVNDRNPLNAAGYILEDGTYLFDYVILFAANIRDRTCDGSQTDGYCTESGVHLHYNDNVRHIINNSTKYIKPLQDKGIKVLLGLLGDHDGIGFASMDDAARATFIADVKKDVEAAGLDGIDFDDEWGSKEDWNNWGNGLAVGASGKTYTTIAPLSVWTYPTSSWGYPTEVTVYRNPTMGIVAGNGQFTAPSATDMTRMWTESGESYFKTITAAREALPDKIISLYEYNTGRYVTAGGEANVTATKEALEEAIDFTLQPWYNRYIDDSANGLPRNIYSPFGMDLSGQAYAAQNGAPNPPIVINGNDQASGTIYDYATRYKAAADDGEPYGMLYFYGLVESANLLKRVSTASTATVTKEDYISMMTKIVFDKECLILKDDSNKTKDW
jgi:hypothetical protein